MLSFPLPLPSKIPCLLYQETWIGMKPDGPFPFILPLDPCTWIRSLAPSSWS